MPTPAVIDVSHWQTIADWNVVASSGIQGVIHKCTEGTSYFDPTYADRKKICPMLFGAYHFLQPGDMIAQAMWFLDHAQPDDNTLLAVDHEDPDVSLDDLKTFMAAVADGADRLPVLYSGWVIKSQIDPAGDQELAQYRLWLAEYTAGTPIWPTATWPMWWLWQYSGAGRIAGITSAVDCDAYAGADLAGEWAGVIKP